MVAKKSLSSIKRLSRRSTGVHGGWVWGADLLKSAGWKVGERGVVGWWARTSVPIKKKWAERYNGCMVAAVFTRMLGSVRSKVKSTDFCRWQGPGIRS